MASPAGDSENVPAISETYLISASGIFLVCLCTTLHSLGALLSNQTRIESRNPAKNIDAIMANALSRFVAGQALEEVANDPNQRFLRRFVKALR